MSPVPRASKTERESVDKNLCHHGRKLCLTCECEEREKTASDLAEARRLLSEAVLTIKDLGGSMDGDCDCGSPKLLRQIDTFLSQQVVQAIPRTEE